MFAGVTTKDIVRELKNQQGIEIEEKFVKLEKKIKEMGEYKVVVDFGGDNKIEIAIKITELK